MPQPLCFSALTLLVGFVAGCSAPDPEPTDAASRRDQALDVVLDAAPSPDLKPFAPCPGGMVRGVTVSGDDPRAWVDAVGAKAVHFWIHWDAIQPELKVPLIERRADVTDARVAELASGALPGIRWAATDALIKRYADLTLVLGVGSGWAADMPVYAQKRVTPGSLGRERYLAQLSRFVRAVVRRYAGTIAGWQIENEPNVAAETLLWGWRVGDAWRDKAFVRQVLETLRDAVRAEDKRAWITINLHTELHWRDDLSTTLDLVDRVGVDAYPNYLRGKPLRVTIVADRVREALRLARGKPVWVMESGYPSAPTAAGFSPERQAQYIDALYDGAAKAGACGLFYFKLKSAEEAGKKLPEQENYWGVFHADGSKKPGWQALRAALTGRQ